MTAAEAVDRAPHAPLTRSRIVAAALGIIDAEGLAALNMRRLGAALNVEAMAVYRHFPNKAAILDGVVAAVLECLDESAGADAWRDGFRTTFLSLRSLLHAHPNALPLVASRPLTSSHLTKRLASMRDLMLRAGLPEHDVLHLLHAGMSLTIGYLWLESGGFVGELPNDAPFLRSHVHANARSATAPSHAWPTPWSRDEDFAAGLELLLRIPTGR